MVERSFPVGIHRTRRDLAVAAIGFLHQFREGGIEFGVHVAVWQEIDALEERLIELATLLIAQPDIQLVAMR